MKHYRGISFDTMRIVLRFVYAKATILKAYQLQSVRSTAKFLGFKSLDRAIKRLQHAPAPPPKPVDTHSETTAPKTMSNVTSDNQTDEQDGVFKNRSFVRHNLYKLKLISSSTLTIIHYATKCNLQISTHTQHRSHLFIL